MGRVITASNGSFAVAGQAIDFGISESFAAGSFALTGRDATLNIAVNISADNGSYTVTGQDAALFAGREIILESGSFTLTGRDVAFGLDKKLFFDAGTYGITGNNITVRGFLEPVVDAAVWTEVSIPSETWTDAA